jgi:signal transduction histidine kinase
VNVGPGPRLTLALASELSFIARHLESPLPAPTVERLQPRVRRAARLATLWLSPYDYNGTTTHGAGSAHAAWKAREVAPEQERPTDGRAAQNVAAAPDGQRVVAAQDGSTEDGVDARDVVLARLEELRAERGVLEERLQLLDRYWRFATHELRNASQSLVMLLERMEQTALAATPWLEPLGRATRTIMQRSQEALDDRIISRGMFTVAPEQIDLVEVALSALEEARPLAEQRGLRLVGERLPVGQPLWAYADPQRVHQILHNLLRNAFDATPQGGFVMLEAAVIDDQACLIVRDSGPGMDPQLAAELLRLGERRAGPTERAGLGLPICRHLAEAMNGNVRPCEPKPGLGAGFMLTLPRSRL